METLNREVLRLNTAVDDAAIRPVAQGYRATMPAYGKQRVNAFLRNLDSPRVFANQVLQVRVEDAATTLLRFVFNSTLGLAGFYDIAGSWGMSRSEADLGQTLHGWGLGDGPYLVLPLAGPSNARDAAGLLGDLAVNPLNWILPWEATAGRIATNGLVLRERNIESLDELRQGSFDYYARLRSVWQQNRDAELGRAGPMPADTAPADAEPQLLDDPEAPPP
ncbi:VacJ family lipoprotein [Pseudoroseomonas globiformis]|uniref:VacJ family lipoprotein n=1 Tax=Teichococcus globiformis TaxID=2307229 RepID=A0ABV7FW16_9PROT